MEKPPKPPRNALAAQLLEMLGVAKADATRTTLPVRAERRGEFARAVERQPQRTIGAASPLKSHLPLPEPEKPRTLLSTLHEFGPTGAVEQAWKAGGDLSHAIHERNPLKGVGALAMGALALPGNPARKAGKKAVEQAVSHADDVFDDVREPVSAYFRQADRHPISVLNGDHLRAFNRAMSKQAFTEADVPLAELLATQQNVYTQGVRKWAAMAGDRQGLDMPLVVQVGGQRYIQDGHHRLAADAQRGKPAARVRYLDADALIDEDTGLPFARQAPK